VSKILDKQLSTSKHKSTYPAPDNLTRHRLTYPSPQHRPLHKSTHNSHHITSTQQKAVYTHKNDKNHIKTTV